MPQNAVVIVRYGPYKSCGIVDHRTFRLIGLQAALKENGHQSVLEKMSDWNKVELVVNGECVYTCSIKQLEFGHQAARYCAHQSRSLRAPARHQTRLDSITSL
uniref:Uncharacterized protein n=1 Tax=Oncorhynchus tshawytscha TaxID=74940 RepID=A0A8C8EHB1_ONCTS